MINWAVIHRGFLSGQFDAANKIHKMDALRVEVELLIARHQAQFNGLAIKGMDVDQGQITVFCPPPFADELIALDDVGEVTPLGP